MATHVFLISCHDITRYENSTKNTMQCTTSGRCSILCWICSPQQWLPRAPACSGMAGFLNGPSPMASHELMNFFMKYHKAFKRTNSLRCPPVPFFLFVLSLMRMTHQRILPGPWSLAVHYLSKSFPTFPGLHFFLLAQQPVKDCECFDCIKI